MFKTQRSPSKIWSILQYNCNLQQVMFEDRHLENGAVIIFFVRTETFTCRTSPSSSVWYLAVSFTTLASLCLASFSKSYIQKKSDQQSPSVWHLVSCLPTFCTPIIAITPCQHVNVHSSWCSSKLDLHLCAWHNILSKQFPSPCPDLNPL